ncbi:MAG TPA: PIN domain-containing protein [Candidatus Methanoperedens sp.]|nr:PIN domain-containing protein [Candidatus Methanoperedens sp.]
MKSKKKSGKSTRRFLVDTNLFIATIKNPKKETTSLRLLLDMIDDTTIALIGNEFLIMEMEKYAKVFESMRGKEILQKLMDKMEVADVDEKFLRICKLYFPEDELIDIYHAATCLQEGAILITNDRHFDKIKDEKIIEVWSISEAIEKFEI